MTDFADFAGLMDPATSNLSPFAIWFSSSSSVRSTLAVVQALDLISQRQYVQWSTASLTWVKVKPFLKSTYFPSMSPATSPDWLSRTPNALKVTFDGVSVLTSSVAPLVG